MKRYFNVFLYFVPLIFAAVIGCTKNEPTPVPAFNYEIPATALQEDLHLGTYYYPYDSIAVTIMEQSFKTIKGSGMDYIVVPHTALSGVQKLDVIFDVLARTGLQGVINYSLSGLKATNAAPLDGAKLESLKKDFTLLAGRFFSQSSYYRISDRPIIVLNALNLPANQSKSIDFGKVVSTLKSHLKDLGFETYVVGEITTGWIPPQRYSEAVKSVDAVTLSDWSTNNYDRSVFFAPFLDMNWTNWRDSISSWEVDFVPNIIPGFSDKHIKPSSALYDIPRSEQLYTDLCNVAKRNLSKARVVFINSWNDKDKRTGVEPQSPYHDTYIEITKQELTIQ